MGTDWRLTQHRLRQMYRAVKVGPKLDQIGTKWDKFVTFSVQISSPSWPVGVIKMAPAVTLRATVISLFLMHSGIVNGYQCCCAMLILCLNHIGELQLFLFYSLSSFSSFSFYGFVTLTVLFLFFSASLVCVNTFKGQQLYSCGS